jgi:predicted  nucleic acid-binding Zn-ribbon protein
MEAVCIDCGLRFTYTSRKLDISRCVKCGRKEYLKEYYKLNSDKMKEYLKEYRILNADKVKEYYKSDKIKEYREKYRKLNADKINEWEKSRRNMMVDSYIAITLGIPVSDCPPELIELKRAHLQLKRQLKTMQS